MKRVFFAHLLMSLPAWGWTRPAPISAVRGVFCLSIGWTVCLAGTAVTHMLSGGNLC